MLITKKRANELGLVPNIKDCVECTCVCVKEKKLHCNVSDKSISGMISDNDFCPGINKYRLLYAMTDEEYDVYRHNKLEVASNTKCYILFDNKKFRVGDKVYIKFAYTSKHFYWIHAIIDDINYSSGEVQVTSTKAQQLRCNIKDILIVKRRKPLGYKPFRMAIPANMNDEKYSPYNEEEKYFEGKDNGVRIVEESEVIAVEKAGIDDTADMCHTAEIDRAGASEDISVEQNGIDDTIGIDHSIDMDIEDEKCEEETPPTKIMNVDIMFGEKKNHVILTIHASHTYNDVALKFHEGHEAYVKEKFEITDENFEMFMDYVCERNSGWSWELFIPVAEFTFC